MTKTSLPTYAQARLRLGILGVGWWVCVCAFSLLSGQAWTWPRWLLLYVVASIPLDFLGGQLLPRWFKRERMSLSSWLTRYLRALCLCLGLQTGGMWLVHHLSPPLAAGAYVVAGLVLLEGQLTLSRWVGMAAEPGPKLFLQACDARFSGGITGVLGRVVLPADWKRRFAAEWLILHAQRRAQLNRSGARAAGLALGLGYNALCLYFALGYSGGSWAATSAWFTLGSFVGLLVLPSLSRPGVFYGDAWMARVSARVELARWLTDLELLQDEDVARRRWTERIFHPVPQLSERLRRLGEAPRWAPWNAARYALLTSWLGGGLLGRAVHCNSGRPELWLWPPCD